MRRAPLWCVDLSESGHRWRNIIDAAGAVPGDRGVDHAVDVCLTSLPDRFANGFPAISVSHRYPRSNRLARHAELKDFYLEKGAKVFEKLPFYRIVKRGSRCRL